MRCQKCGGEWSNRLEHPKQCPICHRYNPEVPRKYVKVSEAPINIGEEKKEIKEEPKLSW